MDKEIKTREELIEETKKIEPIQKRIEFIMQYFKDKLKYNYMELLLGISIQNSYSFKGTQCKIHEDSFLNKLAELCEKYSGDYQRFIQEIKSVTKEELKKYTKNEEEVERNANKFIDYIEENFELDGKQDKQVPKKDEFVSKMILASQRIFDPVIDSNGILVEGVCRDFSKYLANIMREAGIQDVYIVRAESSPNVNHECMMVKLGDEYKIMDMTSIITKRDGRNKEIEGLTIEDWMHLDLGEMFSKCPNFIIYGLDIGKFTEPITAANYDPERFLQLMQQLKLSENKFIKQSNEQESAKEVTLKDITLKGLTKKGITKENCDSAELHLKNNMAISQDIKDDLKFER